MIINVKNLNLNLKKKSILKDISFDFKGNVFFITGINGGGKTSLINCLLGIQKYQGNIYKNIKNKDISYISQTKIKNDLIPLTLKEYIMLNNDVDLKKYKILIKKFRIETHENHLLSELSSGIAQKAKIIKSLLKNKKLIILDEPEINLDHESINDLYTYLEMISKQINIIIITHNVDKILNCADAILDINKRIHFFGNKKEYDKYLKKGRCEICEKEKDATTY